MRAIGFGALPVFVAFFGLGWITGQGSHQGSDGKLERLVVSRRIEIGSESGVTMTLGKLGDQRFGLRIQDKEGYPVAELSTDAKGGDPLLCVRRPSGRAVYLQPERSFASSDQSAAGLFVHTQLDGREHPRGTLGSNVFLGVRADGAATMAMSASGTTEEVGMLSSRAVGSVFYALRPESPYSLYWGAGEKSAQFQIEKGRQSIMRFGATADGQQIVLADPTRTRLLGLGAFGTESGLVIKDIADEKDKRTLLKLGVDQAGAADVGIWARDGKKIWSPK